MNISQNRVINSKQELCNRRIIDAILFRGEILFFDDLMQNFSSLVLG